MNENIAKILSTNYVGSYSTIASLISLLTKDELKEALQKEKRNSVKKMIKMRLNAILTKEKQMKDLKEVELDLISGMTVRQALGKRRIAYHTAKKYIPDIIKKYKANRGPKEPSLKADAMQQRLHNVKWDSSLKINPYFFEVRDYDS